MKTIFITCRLNIKMVLIDKTPIRILKTLKIYVLDPRNQAYILSLFIFKEKLISKLLGIVSIVF